MIEKLSGTGENCFKKKTKNLFIFLQLFIGISFLQCAVTANNPRHIFSSNTMNTYYFDFT